MANVDMAASTVQPVPYAFDTLATSFHPLAIEVIPQEVHLAGTVSQAEEDDMMDIEGTVVMQEAIDEEAAAAKEAKIYAYNKTVPFSLLFLCPSPPACVALRGMCSTSFRVGLLLSFFFLASPAAFAGPEKGDLFWSQRKRHFTRPKGRYATLSRSL